MFLKEGFYTALGTPIDAEGKIVESGLRKEIEQQIEAGCSGLLLMGSMGMQPVITNAEAARAAAIAVDAVKGRCPLFIGIMDNSICRIKERIESLKGLDFTGVVLTAPYYFVCDNPTLIKFFTAVADASYWPVYLYDLPSASKHKLTLPVVQKLAEHPNIMGIKTADITMIMEIEYDAVIKPEFTCLYSGLDTMDVGCAHGVRRYLDGMFATTPKNAKAMEECYKKGDKAGASKHLTDIIKLRDTMVKYHLWPCFTVTMNLLGCEGNFCPDYEIPVGEDAVEAMKACMTEIGEL